MAQQPLTGRGLSQTILQPTDILGEAQARQQQEQMLAARQQAAQKPPKAYEYEGIERYGDLYSKAYTTIDDQIRNFATKHAYELDPDSTYYDKELRRKFDIAVRNSNEAASLMSKNSENFYKDYEELDDAQRSNSGALELIKKVSDLGGKFKIDFETGLVGIEDEDGKFMTFDEVDYITNPRGYYYIRKDWKDLTLDGLDKVYVDKEDMEGGSIKQADLEKIKNQVDIFYNDLDNSVDFQYSVIADYLEGVIGIPGAEKNASNIIRSIIQDGEYVRKDGSVISREEALDWGKNQATNAFIAQHGLTVDKAQDSGADGFGNTGALGIAPIENLQDGLGASIKGLTINSSNPNIGNVYITGIKTQDGDIQYKGYRVTQGRLQELQQLQREGNEQGLAVLLNRLDPIGWTEAGNEDVASINAYVAGKTKKTYNKGLLVDLIKSVQVQQGEKSDSEQDIIEVTTQEQYDSLPDGTKFIYTDPKTGERQTLTKGE